MCFFIYKTKNVEHQTCTFYPTFTREYHLPWQTYCTTSHGHTYCTTPMGTPIVPPPMGTPIVPPPMGTPIVPPPWAHLLYHLPWAHLLYHLPWAHLLYQQMAVQLRKYHNLFTTFSTNHPHRTNSCVKDTTHFLKLM